MYRSEVYLDALTHALCEMSLPWFSLVDSRDSVHVNSKCTVTESCLLYLRLLNANLIFGDEAEWTMKNTTGIYACGILHRPFSFITEDQVRIQETQI